MLDRIARSSWKSTNTLTYKSLTLPIGCSALQLFVFTKFSWIWCHSDQMNVGFMSDGEGTGTGLTLYTIMWNLPSVLDHVRFTFSLWSSNFFTVLEIYLSFPFVVCSPQAVQDSPLGCWLCLVQIQISWVPADRENALLCPFHKLTGKMGIQ